MYAIIKTGGKQIRVEEGKLIRIERIPGDKGSEVVFREILFVSGNGENRIGTPYVENASVIGEIVEQEKGEKIIVFKMKRRKNYRRKKGHRQLYTAVKIKEIRIAQSGGMKYGT